MALSWGIKISKPGYSVDTATDRQLAFSSKFPVLKAKFYGIVNITGGNVYQIAHGFGYRPAFTAYAKGISTNFRFKLPRMYLGSDPVGGGIQGYCYSDETYVYIFVNLTSEVYYYIFTDPI